MSHPLQSIKMSLYFKLCGVLIKFCKSGFFITRHGEPTKVYEYKLCFATNLQLSIQLCILFHSVHFDPSETTSDLYQLNILWKEHSCTSQIVYKIVFYAHMSKSYIYLSTYWILTSFPNLWYQIRRKLW